MTVLAEGWTGSGFTPNSHTTDGTEPYLIIRGETQDSKMAVLVCSPNDKSARFSSVSFPGTASEFGLNVFEGDATVSLGPLPANMEIKIMGVTAGSNIFIEII